MYSFFLLPLSPVSYRFPLSPSLPFPPHPMDVFYDVLESEKLVWVVPNI